jgi:zinc protease
MRNLHLLADELVKELQVVTEERRMRTDDKPRSKLQEHFTAMAYSNSPYKNPVIGWPADIASYKVKDLQAWYERWYAPNNATLVVVGDVVSEEVFTLAEQHFGPLKPSDLDPLKVQTEVKQLGVRRMTIKLPATLPYILMGYKVPSLTALENEEEAYALEVLGGILDGGNSARLSSRLVRGQQIAVSAGAGYSLISRLPGLFLLDATPAKGKTVYDMEYALKKEVSDLKRNLVTAQELARIKAQVLSGAIYERDSNFYQAMQLGMLETVGLGWQKAADYVDNINQVTPEQVQQVARKYLVENHLNIAYLDPQPMKNTASRKVTKGGRHAN